MKLTIDLDAGRVVVDDNGREQILPIGSPDAFAAIAKAYIRAGWDTKYVYSFTWLGRPIIQLPDDMIRLQEIVYAVQPDVIVDIGVAHGGSLVFLASLCKAMDRGRVVGVDIEIRPHNRAAIEAHPMFKWITLIEGDSISAAASDQIRAQLAPGDRTLFLLDGRHTRDHVRAELELYAPLVSVGSYIVAMDGIQKDMVGAPRSSPDWATNNPTVAAIEFVRDHPDFVLEDPPIPFNEGTVTVHVVTYWPQAFVKRIR